MRRRWASALLALAAVALGACKLPNPIGMPTGSLPGLELPAASPGESEVGREMASRLLGRTPLLDDPQAQTFINRLGHWLALHSERPELPWRFGILDTDQVQAFAVPGGTVLVSRGLMVLLETEDEVAGLLAHEIVHVAAGHHHARIRQGTAGGAERLLDALAETASPLEQAARAGLEAYVEGLGARTEYATDLSAVRLAAAAGYDPYGLVSTLAMFAALTPGDNRLSLYFNAHPPMSERVQRLLGGMPAGLAGLGSTLNDDRRWQTVRAALLQAGGA